jgi:hypothetical protein
VKFAERFFERHAYFLRFGGDGDLDLKKSVKVNI